MQGGQDPTAFLDLDLSQPGPSTYHRQQPQTQTQSQPQHQSTAHHYRQPDHDYVHSDAEDDESLVQVKEETQDEQQEGDAQGVDDMDSEEPLYVNAKQYHRILKRRMARARLEELNRLVRSRKVCIGLWLIPNKADMWRNSPIYTNRVIAMHVLDHGVRVDVSSPPRRLRHSSDKKLKRSQRAKKHPKSLRKKKNARQMLSHLLL